MNKLQIKIILLLTLIAALVVAVFFWNEARKEIVFLCGNFKKGVSEQNVRSQLDTGNLPSGKRIIVDSAFNLFMYKCVIDFEMSGGVKESRLE